jgi:hypothetical protein
MPRPSHRTITVSPSAWTDRIVIGRNGSGEAAKRAANGVRTSSMNSCLSPYSFDATEWPSIRQTISGANTSVTEPVPSRHTSSAWRMTCRWPRCAQ